jgi:hypothetical protein
MGAAHVNSSSSTDGTTRGSSRRRQRPRIAISGLLAVGLSVVGLVALAAPATAAPLTEVAPVDNATGYPFWFGDGGDPQQGLAPLRLELCLDDQQDPLCSVVGDRPQPDQPLSIPENFPDESFWWSADAVIQPAAGIKARLVMGQEAAFGGVGEVAVGQQVAFSRLRIRIDGLPNGASYHVTTPYGERDVEADDRGRVFVTEDQGCLAAPCDFRSGLNGEVGPFLRWDSDAPDGYVGDPAVTHTVTGSPTGDNFFRVEGPGIGGPGVDSIETNQFTVQGRIAKPRATVDLPGDLYQVGTQVQIMPSFPGESEVVYTTDGSDPLTSDTATSYASTSDDPAATVTLPDADGSLTLKYAARADGQTSQVYTQDYTVRDDLTVVTATPAPAVAPDVLEGRQDVELSAATNGVPTPGPIYYTTDGTRPRFDGAGDPLGTTHRFTTPIPVTRTTVITAISAPDPTDAVPVPEPQPVARFRYTIHNLRNVSSERTFGYPDTLTDIGLPAGPGEPRTDAVELELCLDDPLCPVVGDLPDPTRGVSFPDNFPDESFWWSGEANFTAGAIRARLVLGAEAAFDTPTVRDGHQVAFGRIRARLDDAVPGATYEIVHPYGVIRATADDTGRLFYTDDNGCMSGPCGSFDQLLTQPVGPFLRWDSGAPAGYVGDPNIEHTVTGSPYGTNEFTVTQVTDGAGDPITPEPIGSTDLFTVQGKLAGPGAMANWQTGTFNHHLQVTLTGNSRTDEIRYTLDGSTPTATSGQVYDGPIDIGEGTTTLNYVAIGGGATSTMESETYTVDSTAPVLSASPAGGHFDAAQEVTLGTDDPTATVRYTLDGSAPDAGSAVYTGAPITVANTLTLRAVATDPLGNQSSESWSFTITPPPTTDVAPTPGFVLARTTAGPVRAGGATALNGVLAPNGQAVGGAHVVLQSRPVTTSGRPLAQSWVAVDDGHTAADGSFAFTGLTSQAAREYRAVFAVAADGPIASATKQVTVHAVVSLARPHHRVARGHKVSFRGTLAPALHGQTVVVTLDGPGRHTKRVHATVSRSGAWTAVVRAPQQTGRWKAVAAWHGNSVLLGGHSPSRTFRVVR